MKMKSEENWYWFKELVIELRTRNNEIMKHQNGVFVEITLIDRSINAYVSVLPHSVDLRGGKCTVRRKGKLESIDLKYLVINKTIRRDIVIFEKDRRR